MNATVALAEPQKICGSHEDREERAQRLANLFIGEMIPLLVQVRQDFFDKEPNETICGITTFTEYCTQILRYSEGYIRQLIKGQNPASQKHDGSAQRKVKAELPEPRPDPEPHAEKRKNRNEPLDDFEKVRAVAIKMLNIGLREMRKTEANHSLLDSAKTWAQCKLADRSGSVA